MRYQIIHYRGRRRRRVAWSVAKACGRPVCAHTWVLTCSPRRPGESSVVA